MANFFDRVFGRSAAKGSGSKAKERLQFILVHDRIHLPPEMLEQMKAEILAVISKYVSIDSNNVDIALQRRDRDSLIVAEIPFSKTAEGIEQDDPQVLDVQQAERQAARAAAEANDDTQHGRRRDPLGDT